MREHESKQQDDGTLEIVDAPRPACLDGCAIDRMQSRLDGLEDDVQELRALLAEADERIRALEADAD